MKPRLLPSVAPTNVGVFVDPIGHYGRGVIRGILAYCRYKQWQLSMLRQWIFQPMPYIGTWAGDGLIAMLPDLATAEQVTRAGRPLVCVSSLLAELHPMSVLADDQAIGRLAARYFLDRGFRHFAFAGFGETDQPPAFVQARHDAFAAEIAAAGFSVRWIDRPERVAPVLADAELPLALFAANDEIGIQALMIAEQQGLRVPEQVAILGVDNDDLLVESRRVSLSSIQLPTFRIGFQAAALLDQLLKGLVPERPLRQLPPVGVVTRKSTDITAIEDPEVMAALAFIRQHVAEPIDVSDVVAAVPVSRRVLERRFQKHLQRSLLEEIQRVRIDRAGSLLIETELSVMEVARASGFSSRSRFHTTFALARGHTPATFRRLFRQSEAGPGA